MNCKPLLHVTLLALIAMGALPEARVEASTIGYHVSVNTASLAGSSSAPFAVDFQLNGGNPLGNTATVSNFTFGGGTANAAPPANVFGLVSGSLASSVILSDSSASFFNEFYQGFTPGSFLAFDILLTTNINTPTPDAFSFAILDKNLAEIPATGLGDSLVLINLNSDKPAAQAFAGTGEFSTLAASVPEAPALPLLAVGLIGVGEMWRRKRSA